MLILQKYSWLFVLVFAAVFWGITQFSTQNLISYDGQFHIKYAWLMRTEGLLLQKDILPFTILKGEFLNYDFLYHCLLMPFTFLDLRIAGKVAPAFFGACFTIIFYATLRRRKAPWPVFWTLFLLSSSYPFLYRMSMAQVMNIALILHLVMFLALVEDRLRLIFLAAFLSVWLHFSSSFIAPLMAFFYVLGVLPAEQRFRPAPLGYAVGGWVAGFIINPFFPGNIIFSLKANFHKLFYESSVDISKGWNNYCADYFFETSFLSFVALFAGIVMVGLAAKKIRRDTMVSLFIAAIFALLFFKTRRFVEYWTPFTILFSAFATRDFFGSEEGRIMAGRLYRFKEPLSFLLIFMVAYCLLGETEKLIDDFSDSTEINRYGPAARWLKSRTEEGEVIFNTKWEAFPKFFFHNSKNALVSGMNPVFMEMEDHKRFLKYKEIIKGKVKNPSDTISSLFKARYILATNGSNKFIRRLSKDRRVQKVFSDEFCSVFEIRPAKTRSSPKIRKSKKRTFVFSPFFPAVLPQSKK